MILFNLPMKMKKGRDNIRHAEYISSDNNSLSRNDSIQTKSIALMLQTKGKFEIIFRSDRSKQSFEIIK